MSKLLHGLLVALLVATGAGAARSEDPTQSLERDKRLIETYRGILSEEPGDEHAYRRLLETAHVVGGVVGLVQLYKAQVEKDPKDVAGWLVLGNLQRTADNVDAAKEAFAKAAALEPGRAEPHLLLAALLRDKHAFAEAFAAYDRAIALIRDRDMKQDALRAAAETAIEAKEAPRAEAYFEKLAQTEPQNLFLRMQAASALARLEEPALALEKWLQIEAKAGGQLQHLVVVWKEIAELQTQLGRYADAEASWRKGLERLSTTHYERRTFIEGLVSIHRRQDRLRELITELEPKADRDVELTLTLARLHEELAEDDKALAYYREAQKRKPSDEEPRMAALRILERIGRPEEILQAWVELVRAFPQEPRHQLKLAELYFQHTKPKDAAELMRKISRNYPSDPGVHAQLVDLWLRYGDKAVRAEVENEYKILQRLEPNEAGHVMSLGEFYWSSGDKERADGIWKRLLKMGKRPGEGHFLLGETLTDHDQHDAARKEFDAAIAAEPDNTRYRRALALLHEKTGHIPEALDEWMRVSERASSERTTSMTREAREHIIVLWEKTSRLDGEIGELARKFNGTPPDLRAGRFLAVALLRLGRMDEARVALERMDTLVPDDAETLAGLEQVYTRQNEPKKAIAVLERLAKSNPGAVEYLYRAADLALGMGDEASALKAAKAVLELAPADANAHARVGELYLRMGYRSEAADSWRQALVIEPRNFPVRFKLASLYRDMGNPSREEQVLADIVREANEGADILRAGRRLLQLALTTGRLAEVEALLRPLVDPGRGQGRGRGAQLRLVVDVYGHLAQALRFSDEPRDVRERKLAELGERALRPLLEALEDNDIATRTRAIETLELTHPAGATPALARLAAEPESMAQLQAISALGRIGTAGAVAALGRLSLPATLAQTRELALWALGYAPTADATAVLFERRKGTPRDRTLIAAAVGFGRHPDSLALAIELASDQSQDVRETGVWALGRLRNPEAVKVLADRLARAATPRESRIAAWGLGQIGTAEARAALVERLWLGTPQSATDDAIWLALAFTPERTSRDTLIEAAYGALAARDRGIVQPVRATLYQPEMPDGPPEGGDWLLSLVGEPGHEGPLLTRVRGILERPEAAPKLALVEALVRQMQPTSGANRGALSLLPPQLGDGRAATQKLLALVAEPLLACVEAEADGRARDTWLILLASWRDPASAARVRNLALETVVQSDGSEPLRGALMALTADQGLAATLADPKAKTTREALGAAFARLTKAPAPELRAALARALSALGDAQAQVTLAELAQDPTPLVRIAVAQAIADAHLVVEPGLIADLFDLVRDPLPDVSVAAVHALVAQDRPELVTRLRSDPTPHVQRALLDRTPAPR